MYFNKFPKIQYDFPNLVGLEVQDIFRRIQFTENSKNDLRKLLNGVAPYLKMKSLQAQAVLQYIDEKDATRKEELKRLVRFENWKDDKKKSSSLLETWGIDEDTIDKYRGSL